MEKELLIPDCTPVLLAIRSTFQDMSTVLSGKLSNQVELEQTLQECEYREQQLELANDSLQRRLERVTEDKEDREKEAVNWFNALEVSGDVLNYKTSSAIS